MPNENWYFTFMLSQHELSRYYIKISGTYEEARQKMVEMFGPKFAFQYSEKQKPQSIDFYKYKELLL